MRQEYRMGVITVASLCAALLLPPGLTAQVWGTSGSGASADSLTGMPANPFNALDLRSGAGAGGAGLWKGFGGAAGPAGGPTGTPALGASGIFNLPAPAPISRPLVLRPPKPLLVAPRDGARAGDLRIFADRRAAAVAKLREARRNRDAAGMARALRELDRIRLERLERLRAIAERVVPEAKKTDREATPSPTEAPILSIPKLGAPENK